eukprot:4538840-Alexandrium_andersonii.AAC.1
MARAPVPVFCKHAFPVLPVPSHPGTGGRVRRGPQPFRWGHFVSRYLVHEEAWRPSVLSGCC